MITHASRYRRLALFALLLPAITPASAGVFQSEFSAGFVLKSRGALIGKTQWSLVTRGDRRLVYQSRSATAGIAVLFGKAEITERSEWQRVGETWQPMSYRYVRTGKKRKQVAVDFDWTSGLAVNTAAGESWSMPVPNGTLDKLGFMLAMMHDLGAGLRALEYPIADGGKLKRYHLQTIGAELLQTPIGLVETLKVERIRADTDRETTFWCAPELGFLPVKMEHKETDGSVITLTIESLEGIAHHALQPNPEDLTRPQSELRALSRAIDNAAKGSKTH